MRVVVTGGAGFIGRAVVKRLADRGDEVVALVRDPAKAQFLAGNCRRLAESVAIAARVGGHRPARISLPTAFLRVLAPINDRIGGLPSFPEICARLSAPVTA